MSSAFVYNNNTRTFEQTELVFFVCNLHKQVKTPLQYVCVAFRQICDMIESGAGSVHWERDQHAPYYVNGRLWVGYDNVRSITDKVGVLDSCLNHFNIQ